MANSREEAEKAYRLAEECFLAGDLSGALRSAWSAKRLFASLPALRNAAAAYDVHVAAASRVGRRWYAVLGLRPEEATITHEDVKKQYKSLCLVLHPDKNRSAAADGAFKLLQQAWETLSDLHPPGAAASRPSRAQPRRTYAPPPRPRDPPPGARTGRYASGGRPPPPPAPDWSSYGFTPPPEPDGSTFDFKAWRAAYARANGTIYCGHCDWESAAGEGKSGERCHSCGARFSPPRQGTGGAEPSPPPPPRGEAPRQRDGGEFTCPAACPRCGERFSASVSVGLCNLRCQACSYDAKVHVRSRGTATAF
ncbi:unnamed protein product [Urochloa decumbens]|uniref:J domain-containing protein n=1 Tax=Urochloa decumbens TaxID=240449 RepID=A0ABC8YLN0_9POAL